MGLWTVAERLVSDASARARGGLRRLRWLSGVVIALAAVPSSASADELHVTYSPSQPVVGQPVQIVAEAINPNGDPQQVDVFVRASAAPCGATAGAEAAAGGIHVISETLPPATNTTVDRGSFTPTVAGAHEICGYENFPGQTDNSSDFNISFTVVGSSGGSTHLECTVPRLVGKRLGAAKHALRAAHCGVGKVVFKKTKRAERGRVVSQRPHPGTRGAGGTKVRLVVGR